MLRLGLSGGIGSGKSTVSSRLGALGAVIVDSDQIAREVLARGTPGLDAVVDRFGPDILDATGALDRGALSQVVFADAAARGDLEDITHPLIAARTHDMFAQAGPEAIVVHDVPLLVEKGMGPGYHLVVIVHASEQERLRRLTQDRGMSAAAARSRMASQAGDAARAAAADVWLDNSGLTTGLTEQVDDLWRHRIVPYEENLHAGFCPHRSDPRSVQGHPRDSPASARVLARLRRVLGAGEGVPGPGVAASAAHEVGETGVIHADVVLHDLGDLDSHLPSLATAGYVEVTPERSGSADAYEQSRAAAQPRDDPAVERILAGVDPGRRVVVRVRQALPEERPGQAIQQASGR